MTGAHVDLAAEGHAESRLVDRRTGIITRLVHHGIEPRFPLAWVGVSAHVADTARYASWTADRHAFGAALGDLDRARRAAVGEAVERYCGNISPVRLPVASYQQHLDAGTPAVDPGQVALYSARQHAQPGFPFQPFGRQLQAAWAAGTDLHTGTDVLVPASLVYLNHPVPPGTSPTNPIAYSGIATGPNLHAAQASAMEELIERDATTIWWASGAHAARITDADHVLSRLDDPGADARSITLLHVPSDLPVPVVAAYIEDHHDHLVAFGSACRADATDAAEKALVEAFGLLSVTRKLTCPESDLWRAVANGSIPAHTYQPYRAAARDYRKAMRADHRDLTDLPAIAQLYLDPDMQGEPLHRLRHPATDVRLEDIPNVPTDNLAARYLQMLTERGLSAIGVDLTTPDIAAAGLAVARVVVPGLYGNAPPAYPYRGGHRLYEVPTQRGWISQPVGEERLTHHPLPLA